MANDLIIVAISVIVSMVLAVYAILNRFKLKDMGEKYRVALQSLDASKTANEQLEQSSKALSGAQAAKIEKLTTENESIRGDNLDLKSEMRELQMQLRYAPAQQPMQQQMAQPLTRPQPPSQQQFAPQPETRRGRPRTKAEPVQQPLDIPPETQQPSLESDDEPMPRISLTEGEPEPQPTGMSDMEKALAIRGQKLKCPQCQNNYYRPVSMVTATANAILQEFQCGICGHRITLTLPRA